MVNRNTFICFIVYIVSLNTIGQDIKTIPSKKTYQNHLIIALKTESRLDSIIHIKGNKQRLLEKTATIKKKITLKEDIKALQTEINHLSDSLNNIYKALQSYEKTKMAADEQLQKNEDNTPDLYKFNTNSNIIYSSENPIPKNINLPDGISYRIQLGVYSNYVPYGSFKGLSPISAETTKNDKIIKYYAGLFGAYNQAKEALIKVKSKGFTDAYIISYLNGKKIPVDRAKKME
jgi:hypothetical protein